VTSWRSGSEKEILSQLELVGVNNIVVTPIPDNKNPDKHTDESETSNKEPQKFSKGLDILDALSIKKIIPSVKSVSPEIIMNTYVINSGKQNSVRLIGVTPNFFKSSNINIEKGKFFSNHQLNNALPIFSMTASSNSRRSKYSSSVAASSIFSNRAFKPVRACSARISLSL